MLIWYIRMCWESNEDTLMDFWGWVFYTKKADLKVIRFLTNGKKKKDPKYCKLKINEQINSLNYKWPTEEWFFIAILPVIMSGKCETDKNMFQKSVLMVSKIEQLNWMRILYHKDLSRHNLFKGSECRLGANTRSTWTNFSAWWKLNQLKLLKQQR